MKVFLFLAGFVFTLFLAIFLFEKIPHVSDEIAFLFQAKTFAVGHLSITAPPAQFYDFFEQQQIILNDGLWYSPHPPGFPFFLSIGVLIGLPYVINPLFAMGLIIVTWKLGRQVFGDSVATLGAVLLLLSPFFLFMSATYMTHPSSAFFITLAILLSFKAGTNARYSYLLPAGVAWATAFLIRPWTTIAISAPFIITTLLALLRKKALKRSVVFLLPIAGAVFLMLIYNYLTNGSPFVFGQMVKFGPGHSPGFGPAHFNHTALKGWNNTVDNIAGLNRYLFEWPLLPSLLFIPVTIIACFRDNRVRLLTISSFALIIAYFAYFYQDLAYGPRFYYELIPILVLFTAKGVCIVYDLLGRSNFLKSIVPSRFKGRASSGAQVLFVLFFVLCFVYTATFSVPNRYRYYGALFHCVDSRIEKLVESKALTNAVVLISGPTCLYGAAFTLNDLALDGEVVYARYLSGRQDELKSLFPDRKFYYYGAHFIALPSDEEEYIARYERVEDMFEPLEKIRTLLP